MGRAAIVDPEVEGVEEDGEDAGATEEAEELSFERVVVDRKGKEVVRPVVHTIEECLGGQGDYFFPGRGWIRSGGKAENDPPEVSGVLASDLI